MSDSRPTPQFTGSLRDFVADLRTRVFKSQQKAADYFLIIRSNISRYEDGKYIAPVLYMTELARLYAEYSRADEKIEQILLSEVNRAIVEIFESERPYRNWNDLVESGKRYVEIQKAGRQSKETVSDIAGPDSFHFGEPPPDSRWFLGRNKEKEIIKSWLLEGACRIVSIVGLGGMGKTLLAKQASVEVADSFQRIIWYSLRNRPPLDEIIKNCLRLWNKGATENDLDDVAALISKLVDLLRAQKCLLVLDNFESVFQQSVHVGDYLPGYEDYGRFLHILSEVDHNSCILLTSRERPREFATMTGDASVKILEIQGVDVNLAQEILRSRNLHGTPNDWERFVHMFSGNPWILKATAETIKGLFRNSGG